MHAWSSTAPAQHFQATTRRHQVTISRTAENGGTPRFRSVPDTAEVLGMSEVTLYRAIREGQFPAIKVRGRYVVPSRVLDDMESAAITSGAVVDAAEYTTGNRVA
ncbi:DNA-binding protein [Actinoplanes sp. ATCC 53533]|uniref:helix-turn-helix domain-containing protein n=1 Tax=Actinoplanes sp. ATCC 53533 TaxID=1288362 RepID=UPI000F7BA22E|nr:helix-turn-helix domain-containing protein [Actinoplanes sp. ATCC 53533]RSM59506.1 DNA-binding protein [Actinoplanes sp. ATCC 53533]